MQTDLPMGCTAFADAQRIGTGTVEEVALMTKRLIDQGSKATILIFDNESSEPIEIDFRGTEADVRKRLQRQYSLTQPASTCKETHSTADETIAPKGPGRPKLGVVAREVTLLPTHWQWLNSQPGGASVALRKLVEAARKANQNKDRLRCAQEATYRFMSAMAGNFAGFEEATRALFAARLNDFEESTKAWPADVREHAMKISKDCFAQS
ncbi:MAG: DUF2239 family protein [Candidatus Obscuribacterales bacterium]|nr:DUF2239 family protein [Candidatus Obscuribacterales bacterium]